MARPAPSRRGLLLALTFFALVAPWVKQLTAQPASRIALTAAVVDHGTIRLDRYDAMLGIDRVERDGHLYSDKAPGQPLLAVPVYAIARAVGGGPAEDLDFDGDLVLWWVTVWSAAVPGALLVLAVHHSLRHTHPRTAAVAAASIGFGTLILPFSAELYGHVLATCLGFGSWLVLRRVSPSVLELVCSGALIGGAVLVEYQLVLLGVVLAVVAAHRRPRDLGWYVLGGAPFALGLLAYQAVAFGGPLRTSYSEKPGASVAVAGWPDPLRVVEVLFGTRGLLLFAPILALALVGLWKAARNPLPGVQRDAVVGLVVFVSYLLLQGGWGNPWGGEMPGPRYLITALPFLALGIAEQWRGDTLHRVLLAGSALAMAFPLVTLHLVPDGGATVISHVRNIDWFGIAPTVWTLWFGGIGWVLHLATVAACLAALRSTVDVPLAEQSAGESE